MHPTEPPGNPPKWLRIQQRREKVKRFISEGKKVEEIALRLKRSEATIRRDLNTFDSGPKWGRPPTKLQLKVYRLREANKTFAVIADKLNRSIPTVHAAYKACKRKLQDQDSLSK